VKLFSSAKQLHAFLEEAYEEKNSSFVSAQTPLLSNLSILENVALVSQVHQGLNRIKAQEKAFIALEKLGISHLSFLRYNECDTKDIFCAQLARAAMIEENKVIIEQPFSLLAEEVHKDFIFDALQNLDIAFNKVFVLDLEHQESFYKEGPCHIEK